MSCTVEIKDITKLVKNNLLDVSGVTPTKSGVFENYTKKNPDRISDALRSRLKEVRDIYQEDEYGKFIEVSKEEYGTAITINPPQALADAMTLQNFQDDARKIQQEDASRAGVEAEDDYLQNSRRVAYSLKAVEALTSDKAEKIFEKGEKNNWKLDKILTELHIPKEQKQIVQEIYNEMTLIHPETNELITPTADELAVTLMANNSFTVEINTAKKKEAQFDTVDDLFEDGNYKELDENTQYYSNLTVPGGTNYTENEIATPDITPSIKGHAQFATSNGIGWFRSDDASDITDESKFRKELEDTSLLPYDDDRISGENKLKDKIKQIEGKEPINKGIKTRRILEVQSDLFQKGRDRKDLISKQTKIGNLTDDFTLGKFDFEGDNYYSTDYEDGTNFYYKNGDEISSFEFIRKRREFIESEGNPINKSDNQFLQLLNKKGNWVNFFIQAIVQDSVKKGYEKVLFPSGNTASKVEGHTTLEEFKKQKEDRIKELEKDIQEEKTIYNKVKDTPNEYTNSVSNTDIARQSLERQEKKSNEINQLKQELERVEGPEGFGALKPIYNFYENRVANILNKLYTVEEVTDEYGNTWNQVDITVKENQSENISFSRHSTRTAEPSNSVRPQGNNYTEFVRYKQDRLKTIQNELSRLNFSLNNASVGSNVDVRDLNRQITTLEKEKSIIDRQLEALLKDQPKYMFHAILEDVANLEKALESDKVVDVGKVSSRLEFLQDFLKGENREYKGEALDEFEGLGAFFENLAGRIEKLLIQANKKTYQTARDTIIQSEQTQELLENNDELEVGSLFQTQKDLNWLETYTLGVTADRTNNTIIPQALYALVSSTIARKKATVESWNKELKALVDANPELDDPSFIKEKDAQGKETGFIINLFAEPYYRAMSRFKSYVNKFSKEATEENYTGVIDELLKHNEIIDFTKLSVVKDVFSTIYPDRFTSDDATMSKYEAELQRKLGVKYDEVINQVINRLLLFEEKKVESLSEASEYGARDLASQNIWDFNAIMQNPAQSKYSKIRYKTEDSTETFGVLFRDFQNLTYIPKEHTSEERMSDEGYVTVTSETGYYNQEFREISKDPIKLQYWELIKKMSEYISSTYESQTYGRLTYPKIQREYAERLQQGVKDKALGRIVKDTAKEYKSWFFERGREKKGDNISKNYIDSFESEVSKLAKTYEAQGINKVEAFTIARGEILSTYSQDFNSNMVAVTMEAALHDARLEVQPMSEAYIKFFRSIDPTRTNAIKKLEHFYEKIILNSNIKYRGSEKTEGRDLSENTWLNRLLALMERIPYVGRMVDKKNTYLLSDAEAKVLAQLKVLQKKGGTTADYSFSLDDIIYTQKEGRTFEIIEGVPQVIPNEYFQEMFNEHIQQSVDDLGLNLNLAGLINGIMKTVIFKGLALNPVSGIFNRIEGKHSSMIMDATGEYWTTGNIDSANHLMMFANITRLSKGRLSPLTRKRKDTLVSFDILMKQFNILQDRKNELQRSAEEAKFNRELLNPYMFAVENPEYKNQGAIIMAVMMDHMVEDNNGDFHPMLNKETGQFSIYDLVDGVLKLKPEFRGVEGNIRTYEQFRGSTSENLVAKMTDAVSRSQGNYNALDIMMAKQNVWGRAATIFMTWFAEHVNQRFGKSGDKNYNLNTGKKRKDGRFVEAYKTNKLNTALAGMTGLGIIYGVGGPVLLAGGVGALGFIAYRTVVKSISKPNDIKREVAYTAELVGFLESLLVESLNYPARFLNLPKGMLLKNKSFGKITGKNMSKQEVEAMRAITRELAVALTWLSAKLLIGAMMYDDDDDKDSPQRKKYNFIQNQISRVISTLIMYADPYALVSDQSRIAALDVVKSVYKVLAAIWDEKMQEDIGKSLLDVSPIPRILTKGEYPWHNKMNYDEMSNFDRISSPMNWTSTWIKNNAVGPERDAEIKYKKIRAEVREQVRAELMEKYGGKKSLMKKEVDKLVEERVGGNKKKNQTYVEKVKEMHALGL